jgi:peptidoglycan/xylan/chitin deacetylase (PgdA/CDA1 family)
MKKMYLIAMLSFFCVFGFSQKQVAITIDDVPRTKIFERDNQNAILLNKLDSLNIPVTVFINEGLLYVTSSSSDNYELMNRWVSRDYVTLGNHTFSHSRYSEVGFEKFTHDIDKGDSLLRILCLLHKKDLKYFRFPYNDQGKDSLQHYKIRKYLNEKQYEIAPFTIESSDWMFNYLYEHFLNGNNLKDARKIAEAYIKFTLKYFAYFDSLSIDQYGRQIKQIFLCHDNMINRDYLDVLVHELNLQGYSFISLDKAMKDEVYTQQCNFYKKWGISWFYRWMNSEKQMKELMQGEPDLGEFYKEYKKVKN